MVQYELLDEIMDFGYPQFTEAKILSEFIKTDAYRLELAQRPPMAVTNAVSWRSEGVFYKTNEVRQAVLLIIYSPRILFLRHFLFLSIRCFLMLWKVLIF